MVYLGGTSGDSANFPQEPGGLASFRVCGIPPPLPAAVQPVLACPSLFGQVWPAGMHSSIKFLFNILQFIGSWEVLPVYDGRPDSNRRAWSGVRLPLAASPEPLPLDLEPFYGAHRRMPGTGARGEAGHG